VVDCSYVVDKGHQDLVFEDQILNAISVYLESVATLVVFVEEFIRKKIGRYIDIYSLHSASSTIDTYPFCSTHRQGQQFHRH
jgi:hypothetical protein